MKVTIKVNGNQVAAEVADRTLLVHFVREVASLTATNVGCDSTSCGACTVLLDGKSVKSCTVLAAQADGCEVTTVEGLADGSGEMHPVQSAFHAEHGLQCGFCTPGMVMASVSHDQAGHAELQVEPPARDHVNAKVDQHRRDVELPGDTHALPPARLRGAWRRRLPSSLLRSFLAPRSSVQAAPRPFGSLTRRPPCGWRPPTGCPAAGPGARSPGSRRRRRPCTRG